MKQWWKVPNSKLTGKFFTVFLIFNVAFSGFAQDAGIEILKPLREKVNKAVSDAERIAANDSFIVALEKLLESEKSYYLNFDSVKQIGLIPSPDNSFRIITWNLPFDNETNKYYCYIQRKEKKKNYSLIRLKDSLDLNASMDSVYLSGLTWYGALYYQVIPFSVKRKNHYILLGWDGNNAHTRKKIVDVLVFDDGGQPVFGEDVFFKGKEAMDKRIVFEYSSKVTMSMKYHPDRKQIVFDHLSPSQPEMESLYQYYGPDFSYDALELKRGKWYYLEDVDIRLEVDNPVYNPEKKKEKTIYSPKL